MSWTLYRKLRQQVDRTRHRFLPAEAILCARLRDGWKSNFRAYPTSQLFPGTARRGRCFAETDLIISLRRALEGMGTLARFRAVLIRARTSGSSSTLPSGFPAS